MSSEWKNCTLGDVLTLQRGMDLPTQDRNNGHVPIVASNGVVGYHNVAPVKGPGVIIGRSGSIGGGQYVIEDFWPLNTTLWVKDFKGNNPRFCYYLLRSIDFSGLNAGSGVPTLNRNHLHPMPLVCPSVEEQILISELLGALDDRIALLRETNTTLEAIAQALFKSWFVDFDPVRAKQEGREPEDMDADTAALFPDSFEESELGLVPVGWRVQTIGDVCDFQNGYAFKSNEMTKTIEDTYKIFKMGNIKKGGGLNRAGTKDYFEKEKSKNLDRYLVKKGDLLMCMTDMKNNVALLGHTALMDVDDQFLLNQRVGLLRSKNAEIANFPFLYILTNSDSFIEDLRSRANSGVQVNLSTSEIKETKFILPSKEVHYRFNEIVEAIQEKIFSLEQQQDSLSEIRDTLLPRLISGQLRLPDAEALIEEATA